MSHKMLVAFLVLTLGIAGTALAAPISYGNVSGDSVVYQQLFEDSSTDPGATLYGAPTVSGDALLFNPSFSASASVAGTSDMTDGQLSGYIHATNNSRIESVVFQEYGDFSLIGAGGAGTYTMIAATFHVNVIQIDGADLTIPIYHTQSMTFAPGSFWSLPADMGLGTPFSGAVYIDVNQVIIDGGYIGKATKVQFSLDNILVAASDGGIATIAKKALNGFAVTTATDIPEPATISVMACGALALVRRRRRA